MRPSRSASPVPDLRDEMRVFDPPLRFREGMREARRVVSIAGEWSSIEVPPTEQIALVADGVMRIETMGESAPISESGVRTLARRLGLARADLASPWMLGDRDRGLLLREHAGVVRAVLSTSYVSLVDAVILDILERHVERASLARRVSIAGVGFGSRTMLRLVAPPGSTSLSTQADLSNAQDGSEALLLRVRSFEPTPEGLIPDWRVEDRVVHRGDEALARVETMVMRAIRSIASPCLRS